MNNFELFNYSSENPSLLFDEYYSKGNCLVLTTSKTEKNPLMDGNEKLIELITVFNYLKSMKKTENDESVQEVVCRVIKILDKVEGINFTAFSQFFMVYNYAYSSYVKFPLEKKFQFIYEMLCRFCEERHKIYLMHGYTNSMLQVVADNYSHKRNSKSTINKIEDFLKKQNFCYKKTLKDFVVGSCVYFLPDKGDRDLFFNFKSKFNIKMESAKNEQGKLPDLVFNLNGQIFIVEAKMMKGSGGGQDKQLVEIINFIRYSEENKNIHYLTYLDGEYFGMLFDKKRSKKIKAQYEDIISCLISCPQNYFVNSAGFEKLILG